MINQIEPWIGEEEKNELFDIIKSNWITEGEKTDLFEKKIADYVGCRYAIAVNNATIGLYMCLKVLGIKTNDEVLVPDMTFIATNNAVIMADGKPVLVDIDRNTFNIDPEGIERKLTRMTKVIMPVHLYGQAADMEKITKIAKKNNINLVEDAAQGVGVKLTGKHVGTFGDMGVFSFYGNKTITTGEGGMIVTDNAELARKLWKMKNHGRTKKGTFVHESIGFNFCFTDLQAAIGLAQLSKLEEILNRKKGNYELYHSNLNNIDDIQFPFYDSRCEVVPWFTNILLDNPKALSEFLLENGIQTRRFFYPIHRQPYYNLKEKFINSDFVYERGLSLPSSVLLKEKEIEFICKKIREYFHNNHNQI